MKRIFCFFIGHDVEPTGRRLMIIHQMRCKTCNGLFVFNEDRGGGLLPWDWEWKFYFERNGEK